MAVDLPLDVAPTGLVRLAEYTMPCPSWAPRPRRGPEIVDLSWTMPPRLDRRTAFGIGVLLAVITALHYLTTTDQPVRHDLFRRLYYVPVIWGALAAGVRGGLITAAIAICAYLPHAFLMPMHLDPAGRFDKGAEMVMYLVVGAIAGALIDRERRAQARAATEALERAAAEALSARAQSIVHLSRGLAHELRNPLGGIQGAIEILAAAVPPEAPESEMAEVGVREVERLDRVLGDFLSFARPREAAPAPVDVPRVVADVVEVMRANAEVAGVSLHSLIPPKMPTAHADRDQLVQVLINLVRNAIEATPRGGRVEVHGAEMEGGRAVALEVHDTGPGVDAALAGSIYDPYVTGREGGTGLGLSIAASLVVGQGGHLTHGRRPGGGAIFRFTLPTTRGIDAPDAS